MRFTIPGTLTTLNEYVRASRGNKYASAAIKKKEDERILWEIKRQLGNMRAVPPVYIKFRWIAPNKRQDPDNLAFAKKFVMDSLVKAGVIENDGWKQIEGFSDSFSVDKENPRIEVEILEVPDGRERSVTATKKI